MIYELDGRQPILPENGDCWIAPDANLIGDILIEEQVSVWFGATLRGDNERIAIGRGSNLQEACICHTDPGLPLRVGSDCTIGHRAILHGCTIGDNSLIGMGATVMNGAVIGKNCQIGAGALVPEGREIPDGSLVVGLPGKIVRNLNDSEIAGLAEAAAVYRKKMVKFRNTLRSIG